MASLSSDFQLVNQETVKETTIEVIKTESNKKIIFQRFMRHKPAVIGLTVFMLMVLVALLAPVMTQFDPNLIQLTLRQSQIQLIGWEQTQLAGMCLAV